MDMTWGEFKRWVESHEGVVEDTPIWYFDFSFDPPSRLEIDEKLGMVIS